MTTFRSVLKFTKFMNSFGLKRWKTKKRLFVKIPIKIISYVFLDGSYTVRILEFFCIFKGFLCNFLFYLWKCGWTFHLYGNCQDWKLSWKPHRTRAKPHASFPTKIAPHCDGCSFPRILSCLLCLSSTVTIAHALAYCYSMVYYFAYSQSSNSLILMY